jgi:acetyltransferase-like isoleucine patch superfamily enzyme
MARISEAEILHLVAELIEAAKDNQALKEKAEGIRMKIVNQLYNNNNKNSRVLLPKEKILKLYKVHKRTGYAIVLDNDGKKRLHRIVVIGDNVFSQGEIRIPSTVKIGELVELGRGLYITPSQTTLTPEEIQSFYNEDIDII